MDYDDLLRKRLTHLLKKKNTSEYKMSLDLGHSKNYINGITSRKTLPSMTEFFYICEYLEVTPVEFFNLDSENPALIAKAVEGMLTLSDDDLTHLIYFIDRLKGSK